MRVRPSCVVRLPEHAPPLSTTTYPTFIHASPTPTAWSVYEQVLVAALELGETKVADAAMAVSRARTRCSVYVRV